jgi:hypothetical protein
MPSGAESRSLLCSWSAHFDGRRDTAKSRGDSPRFVYMGLPQFEERSGESGREAAGSWSVAVLSATGILR